MELELFIFFIVIKMVSSVINDYKVYINKSKETDCHFRDDRLPDKYMEAENILPTVDDLNDYLDSMAKPVAYFVQMLNDTNVNVAAGNFFAKAILKRCLKDYGDKLQKKHYKAIVDLISKTECIVSHYVSMKVRYDYEATDYRISQVLTNDTTQVHSIENFKRNNLKKWIQSDANVNEYIQYMDGVDLPRDKYLELALSSNFHIGANDSDHCIARIFYNPQPIEVMDLRRCLPDPYCVNKISSSPSIAYNLSHRLLNLLMCRHIRRCYFVSPEEDAAHMEFLCANMYREVVYIARKGYFARDIFLEHIALCGLLGHEEFFRRHWFHKTISWINDKGCIVENRNCVINNSKIEASELTETMMYLNDQTLLSEGLQKTYESLRKKLTEPCHSHPTALLLVTLSHAIRQAAHYVTATTDM